MMSNPQNNPLPLWRVPAVLPLLIVALLAEMGYAVLNISAMPVYLKYDRGLGEGLIGLVVTAFLLSEAVFKGLMGHLSDRFGRRMLISIGPILTIFTSIFTLLLPREIGAIEPVVLVFLRVVDGIGAAMLWPAAFALMGELVSEKCQQEGLSLLNACYFIGIAIALPIGGTVNDLFGRYVQKLGGSSPSLILAAILFAAAAILASTRLPDSCPVPALAKDPNEGDADALPGHDEPPSAAQFLDSWRQIPQFLFLGVVTFMAIGFPMVIIKLFASEQFKLSETQFGLLVLPGALAMAMLSGPMSKLGERIGKRRAVHWGLGLTAFGMTLIAMGAIVPFFRTLLVLACGGIPVGLGFLLAIPAWYAAVSEIDPRRRASNIGAVMTAQGLGAIIGAPVGSKMYEVFNTSIVGRYSPLLCCAFFLLVAWLLSLKFLPDRKGSEG
jgi:DHA1 family multidrug resistance protein-like MFS transporter